MPTQKPGKKPRPLLSRIARFAAILTGIFILAGATYGLYLCVNYLQLERKSAELTGLRLYSVQESHATHGYSWYASFPKIDQPPFDRAVAKVVNDAKGLFLARVNLQAKAGRPLDDLNVSFEVGNYDDRQMSVTLTKHQTLEGVVTTNRTVISYDRQEKRVISIRTTNADMAVTDMPSVVREDTPSHADCDKSKCVALTFNDGPNYETPRILDTLKAYRVKATFFEVGAQSKLYPEVARRTVREGHVVGSLGETHRNLLAAPFSDAKDDLHKGNEAIRKVTGVQPQLARAPYGAVTNQLAKKLETPFIDWNIASIDGSDSSQIYSSVMANIHSGAIVASRDTTSETAAAYARIIPGLLKQGYELVTVPQLLGDDSPEPGVYAGR